METWASHSQLKKDNNEKRFNSARMSMVSRDDPTTTDDNANYATVSTEPRTVTKISTPEKKPLRTFLVNFFARDSNAARCQLSIPLCGLI